MGERGVEVTDRLVDLAGRALISTPLRAVLTGTIALWLLYRVLGWGVLAAILVGCVVDVLWWPLRWSGR